VLPRNGDLFRVPLRLKGSVRKTDKVSRHRWAYRAPVKSFASVDEVVHGPDCLFNGRISVWPVAKQQVDIVQLEALQRHLGALNKMFARQASIIDRVVAESTAPVDLCGDD
jgi:hypothetical protein